MNPLYRLGERMLRRWLREEMLRSQVCLVSNDCWGGQLYKYADVHYNTPFVGLFMMAPCYMELLKDIQGHLAEGRLEFIAQSRYTDSNAFRKAKNLTYPIGLLNGTMEVHFMHYASEQEALEKWTRRCARMNFGNLAIKFDGSKDNATPDLMRRFCELDRPKKLGLCRADDRSSVSDCQLACDHWESDGARMFRHSLKHFDIVRWLNTGEVRTTVCSRLAYTTVIAHTGHLL
ncbi:MAG: DUF1919 domain-containing protein [Flavobacteriales bacterium]|nr:DUF1919 domain-containing protein [Flavobacteriales bacterium]